MRNPQANASKGESGTSLPLPDIDPRDVSAVAGKADAIQDFNALDKEAPRKFTSTTMPFNEYEHRVLMAAVEKSGYKSAKQFMRDAFVGKALKILEGKPE